MDANQLTRGAMKRSGRNSRAEIALLAILGASVLVALFGWLELSQGDRGTSQGWWADTFAQWTMAVFAIVAAGVGVWTILLLRDTLTATRHANELTKVSNERQLRAYIASANVTVKDVAPGKAATITVVWRNTGQTPARVLRASIGSRFGADPETAIFRFPDSSMGSRGVVGAGGHLTSELRTEELTERQVRDLRAGAYNLAIGGYIIYRDVFGVTRRATLRYMLDLESIQPDGRVSTYVCQRNNGFS